MQVVVQISRICLNLLKERLLRKEERAGKSVSLIFTALKFLLADEVEALAPRVKENVPKFMCHIKENSALWFFSLRHRNKEYIAAINKCPLAKSIDFSVHNIKTCNDYTVCIASWAASSNSLSLPANHRYHSACYGADDTLIQSEHHGQAVTMPAIAAQSLRKLSFRFQSI